MCEILFRGKREDNSEWVYGYYVRLPDVTGSVHRMYVPAENPDESNDVYSIDPKTLGQYTGFKDRKGNFIFEGDIIDFDYDTGVVKWLKDGCWGIDDGVTMLDELENVEVSGNIYDGPCPSHQKYNKDGVKMIDVPPSCEAVYDKGFKDGLEKAWEIAKRIFIPKMSYKESYDLFELNDIFGKRCMSSFIEFAKLTVFEVVDKVELYEKQKAEKDKIKDGDEVSLDDGTKGVVVYSGTDGHLNVVNAYGGMRSYNATQVIKTGRHFPRMVEMMKEMRDNDGTF